MRFFRFKCLLAISLMENILAFGGGETKTLNRYTPFGKTLKSRYLRVAKKRRKFDYNYENWEKNNDFYTDFILFSTKNTDDNPTFNTDNAVYGRLRENNNATTFNKETDVNNQNKTSTSEVTSETEFTTTSRNFTNKLHSQITSASETLDEPDLTTNSPTSVVTTDFNQEITSISTNVSSPESTNSTIPIEQDLTRPTTEPQLTNLTSVSKLLNETTKIDTPTAEQKSTLASNTSTDLTNFDETTRDWREIINFTVIPEDTISDLLLLYVNTTPYIAETTLKPPPPVDPTEFMGTTYDILNVTHTTVTTKNPFLVEIEEVTNKTRDGHFTCVLVVLLRTLLRKKPSETKSLLYGMNVAIESMRNDDAVSMFSAMAVEVLQSVVQMLFIEPADIMREHLAYAIYALENRRTFLRPDVNSIFSVVDTIYVAEDAHTIAEFIRDEVAVYPNKSKDPVAVARRAINLFIVYPHARVRGTAKSELLLTALDMVIRSRMFPGQVDRRRAGQGKGLFPLSKPFSKEITKSLRYYNPRHTNKWAQTFLPTRKKWKHKINRHKSTRKMKTFIDKSLSLKINTKSTYKFRRKHTIYKKVTSDKKKYYSKSNNKETTKLRRKNTNTQAISESSENTCSSTSEDSETASSEEKYDTYLSKSKTRRINEYKKFRKSYFSKYSNENKQNIYNKSRSNKHRNQKDGHNVQSEEINNAYRRGIGDLNNNVRAKLINWINKYTDVIYRKLMNEREVHYGTKALLLNSIVSNIKYSSSYRRKFIRNVINNSKQNSIFNAVVQKKEKTERHPTIDTSYENDEESILKFNILKAVKNTSIQM